MRFVTAALAAALVCATAAPAAADGFSATRSDKLVERAHTIDIHVGRGSARMVVRRVVHNGGERHDQATFHIDLPGGAVATALRTSALVGGELQWFDGELLEAEFAARRYKELTGIGGYYPKDPALLSWRTQERLALQVFPCPPGEDKTVEYTLTLPTTYSGGREQLDLPTMGTGTLHAKGRLFAEHPGDALFIDGSAATVGATVTFDEAHEITLLPAVEGDVAATLAMVPFAERKALMHYRVATPPRLSTVPRDANVVVLIDTSRSMSELQVLAAQQAARAYLHHFGGTGAQVAVVPFDRFPRPRSGGFVSVAQGIRDLGLEPKRGNGSAIDAAVQHARSLLESAPAGTPRRVLLVSDLAARKALAVAGMRNALPAGTLLHVATIDAGPSNLDRTDSDPQDEPWQGVARGTGGLLWRASTRAGDETAAQRVFEEWARPVRIHGIKLTMPGNADETYESVSLQEGEEIDKLAIVPRGSPYLRVTGEVWARKVTQQVPASAEEGRRWSALAFGSPILHQLEEREMAPLAFFGRAVTPVTSYLAIEPGVRPSTEGLETVGFGMGGGRLSGSHRARMPAIRFGSVDTFDPRAFLQQSLRDAWRACGGSDNAGGVVFIQTTRDEVVDVELLTPPQSLGASPRCLTEAIWAFDLPPQFRATFQDFTLAV